MSVSFNSWEFLFVLNILFCFLAPLVLSFISGTILFLLLCTFSVLSFLWNASGDFKFHVSLILLHFGVSVLTTSFIFKISQAPYRIAKTYGVLFLSLALSTLAFIATPSLFALDPFWGVLPGTLSLDPVISLHLYELRAWITAFSFLIILILGFKYALSGIHFLLIFSVFHLTASFFTASPFTNSFSFKRHFKIQSRDPNFSLFFESDRSSAWAPKEWKKEIEFNLSEIKSRLPKKIEIPKNLGLSIYFYDSDRSKKYWIGAENPQIGNFIRSEMHLSEIEIDSPVLRHELVHLIHGKLNLPLKSYADPFLFEGLAVALSSDDVDQSILEGSALIQEIQKSGTFEWPRGLDFFEKFSGPVSYRLAGAAAALNLKSDFFPWEKEIPVDAFLKQKVSASDLASAKLLLNRLSLFQDPLARDCNRLKENVEKLKTYVSWENFLDICGRSPLAYDAIFLLSEKRELALHRLLEKAQLPNDLLNEAKGDLAALQDQKKEAKIFYSSLKGRGEWKWKLIQKKKNKELAQILENDSSVLKSLAKLLAQEEADSIHYLRFLNLSERASALKSIQKKRALNHSEIWNLARAEFYQSPLKARQLLQTLPKPPTAADERFKRRLEWELKQSAN